jgi:hypothetical protein
VKLSRESETMFHVVNGMIGKIVVVPDQPAFGSTAGTP